VNAAVGLAGFQVTAPPPPGMYKSPLLVADASQSGLPKAAGLMTPGYSVTKAPGAVIFAN
jgi:hypothetical protein